MVITIDGPAGSGKSTIAQLVAERLGAGFLDTGAMYRAVTLAAMRNGANFTDEEAHVGVMDSNEFRLAITDSHTQVSINDVDETDAIRDPEVTVNVKYIASAPKLRSALVKMQRSLAGYLEKIVTEGRDQGTVAFADADYKFFLVADLAERARRRQAQLKENGAEVDLEELKQQIVQRDASDEAREVGPLVCAEDAITIDTTVLSAGGLGTDVVPVGAKFLVDGETDATAVHTVTARTPSDGLTATTDITFTPALGAGTYVDGGVITYQAIELEIKIGDGNVTYTEANEYESDLDRGILDPVRAGDQVPMDVNLDFVYEYVTTGTGETTSPMDALKQIGDATEWRSSSADPCEPYAVDVEVIHTPLCTTQEIESTVFPDFRSESREPDLGEAAVSVSGRCNATQPIVTRSAHP